ncbi:MAG: IS110 family transposase, partial [Actinobacteria bacterium]|nr:IS110 family transposase [Actinomycetota bacterium]
MLARVAVDHQRPALGHRDLPASRRPRPDQRDARSDVGARARDRPDRLRAACLAKTDTRLKALQKIYGVGPILSCTILAEIGDAKRFRRARQVVRAAGLDPVVRESADKRRRGHLAKQGAPGLRWALVEAAQHASRKNSPDHDLY